MAFVIGGGALPAVCAEKAPLVRARRRRCAPSARRRAAMAANDANADANAASTSPPPPPPPSSGPAPPSSAVPAQQDGAETAPAPSAAARDARAVKLARMLSAQWSNQAQAFENPPFWAHVRTFIRPLPPSLFRGVGMYAESYYDYDMSKPYLSNVFEIFPSADGKSMEVRGYKNTNETEFHGATRQRGRLDSLTMDMLQVLPDHCNSLFDWEERAQMWRGKTCEGRRCENFRGGVRSYLDSVYTLTERVYSSWDTGRDYDTGNLVWGAKAGPFVFDKVESYADEVPS